MITYPLSLDPAYNRLVWVDVETTGLDENEPDASLLEVAAIITDVRGEELDEPFVATIHHAKDRVERLKGMVAPVVLEMHTTTGLWDDLSGDGTMSLASADLALSNLVRKHAPEDRQARLAGNSPSLDMAFSRKFLPSFSGALHYRTGDVTWLGTARVFSGLATRRPESLSGSAKHRALSDIQNGLNEYRTWYAMDRWIADEIASGRMDLANCPPAVRAVLNLSNAPS